MIDMHRRRRQSLFSLAGLASVAILGVGASSFIAAGTASATDQAGGATARISVTISDSKLKLSKTGVAAGTTVSFTVTNTGKAGRTFRIAGKATPTLAKGKRATLTLRFASKGKHPYIALVPGHASAGFKGTFNISAAVKPTTTVVPTTTAPTTKAPGPGGTIAVAISDSAFTFNPAKIPSGDVTFTITNTGTVSHNLDIKGSTSGASPLLGPGQSVTISINLRAGETYSYGSDGPNDVAAGLAGTFVPNF
jgi:plastocyanin